MIHDVDKGGNGSVAVVTVVGAADVGGYILRLDFEPGKVELVLRRAGLAGTEK